MKTRRLFALLAAAALLATARAAATPASDPQAAATEFPVRGFYIDCRHEVMTVEALKSYADRLAEGGVNTIIMEYEATFPFEKHATLRNEYAYTKEEVRDFVAHCAARGIDVIPLQNCFGHSEYILRHDRYDALRESSRAYSQVCPLSGETATQLFREIFSEVAALHPSKYFHIGADETRLLGVCPACAEKVAREGASKLFVDYVRQMAEIVISMGKIPVIWADIILKHPEAVADLPKELIFIDWNYGWDVNRFGNIQTLIDAKVPMWGATAFRSGPDHIYLTMWDKHLKNLSDFIPFARKAGYRGMIDTSWSTSGEYGYHYDGSFSTINHMQPIRSVYPQAGMHMLVEAFCRALAQDEPLDGPQFALDYARSRFGLGETEAAVLRDYYMMPQQIIGKDGKDKTGTPLAEVLDRCVALKRQLDAMRPQRNRDEFGHLQLMLDIRINYLAFRKVELAYESPDYDIAQAPRLLAELQPLVDESERLDARFVRLCKGYLKEGQAEWINAERSERMRWLYKVLQHNNR